MGGFKLIFIIPFFTFGQIDDKTLHFYGTVTVCDIAYHIPKKNKFAWAICTGVAVGVGKEIYDMYKPKPTGFNKQDLFIDGWAILCYIPFRICLNDFNKRKRKVVY